MYIRLKKQIFIAALVYLGQTVVGIALGWSAPVIPKLQDEEQTPLPDVITDAQSSWVASLTYIGVIVGPYAGGYLSNFKGRKPTLLLGATISSIGFVVMAFARHLNVIFAGRILLGFGSGITYVINLVYLGEVASTHIRGILLTITACASTFGTFLVYVVGPYVSYAGTCWLGFAISASFMAGGLLIPESPVFQVLNGEESKAKDNLISLGRSDEIEKVMATGKDINNSSKIEEWVEIFTIKSNRKALFITLTLSTLQQMSGVVTIIFFATTIFEIAGSSIEPHIATIIIGLTQFLASTITPWFVERAGRKSLLMFSTLFTSLSLAVLGIYFYLEGIQHSSIANIGWLPLASLIVCFLAFDLGFGIIPATLTGEMFTANVRSTGSTITITVSCSN
ncbi:facilitated trehalose transporter Tret1-like isoform X2 [Anticarsia gemmatalis]|uniref:facilitated trehalose transporter Tret1-like isoform X2 n=1 Tax=Anticarsia gemmatalis TaxID=129554 RepID=UPI003F762DED